jgi:hypothetical protein
VNIGWPEGIYLALVGLSLLTHALKDREPKTGTASIYHFPIAVVSTALGLGLLYWGGFFA